MSPLSPAAKSFAKAGAFGAGLFFMSLSLAAAPTAAHAFDGRDEERIKALALEAILENPEILYDLLDILKEREIEIEDKRRSEALSRHRPILENDPEAPTLGHADGIVTVVEFFDYNCPFCKRAATVLRRLAEQDARVKLVMRELPILSPESEIAARAALAARKQGKYEAMHWALMALDALSEETIMTTADAVGLDRNRLKHDMKDPEIASHIERSKRLAEDLGVRGTPTFVIGGRIHFGAQTIEDITRHIDEAAKHAAH